MKPFLPNNCAVRVYSKNREALGRCWNKLNRDRCPVHGDVSGVQYQFRQTGDLTNDFELETLRKRRAPLAGAAKVEYGTPEWVERFRQANPRAELVAFRGCTPIVKIKCPDGDFPRIFEVTGGTPERPEFEEY